MYLPNLERCHAFKINGGGGGGGGVLAVYMKEGGGGVKQSFILQTQKKTQA